MMTEQQLRSYLAWAIHGRKPQRRAHSPVRRGPPRDEAYKAWIRTLPSVVSGRTPCEACHTGVDGGMSMKASDLSCLPLTGQEHREYHRIGKRAFAHRYRLDYPDLVVLLNRQWREKCA
jgi:hypothetical protein